MSRKITAKQPNTILNYFQSPKANKSSISDCGISDVEVNEEKTIKKMKADEDIEDDQVVTQSKKRCRIIDSDSDDENSEQVTSRSDIQKVSKKVRKESLSDEETIEQDEDPEQQVSIFGKTRKKSSLQERTKPANGDRNEQPSTSGKHVKASSLSLEKTKGDDVQPSTSGKPVKETTSQEKTKTLNGNIDQKPSTSGKAVRGTLFSQNKTNGQNGDIDLKPSTSGKAVKEPLKTEPTSDILWLHDKLEFLKPESIRDSEKRKRDHPDYDPRTLYVPESFLNSVTPAMRQWWILKSKHYDCVLFFKVGKFYELYHMDAVIGVNYLGFSYMKAKAEFAHSGFPEIAYGKFAQFLADQGFKVARVEQTETPEMMTERCRKGKSKFDRIVTREICQITTKGTYLYGPQMTEAKKAAFNFMLAITEKTQSESSIRYGICFVDTSIGIFYLSEFLDDRHCSKLLALLSEHPPVLILTDRKMSSTTNDILKKYSGEIRIEKLVSSTQFYNADKTIQILQQERYFKNDEDEFAWPNVLCDLIEDSACKPGYELALSALGACHWFLKESLLDIQVFSMNQFRMYEPYELGKLTSDHEYMVLDTVTLQNLDLFGKAGTLQRTLDLCCTAFGKRLLLDWIYRPLCNLDKIHLRQAAVQELYDNNEYLRSTRNILKKLPDLQRQIMKIHTFGSKQLSEQHPDSRAIFYEAKTYFKRKILDLSNTLKGFETASDIPKIFERCESQLLIRLTRPDPDGMFHDLTEILENFKSTFDQEEAANQGKIIPQKGMDADFDKAEEVIKEINKELDDYLNEQRDYFKCNVVYFGSDKKRYQLEIPETRCHKVTAQYNLEGTKKGAKPAKRYSTPRTKELLARMLKAENDRSNIVMDLNRRIFANFSKRHTEWSHVTSCLATLDVLCSLAEYARTFAHDICLPKIVQFADKPFIKIENGRHPCIPKIDDFVPNDTVLGTDDKAAILILTGPNMGGKSTLMRQVALILVMAQMGSYVPASFCQMSLIDRIFTRLGAEDDIMTGQSTFLVEVSEASSILQHSTKHSFVLLDELGRGTSTHDGNAIATAYMTKLLEINCRVIYSTHYHTLVEHYGGRADVQLGHMTCLVENEGEDGKETVTFLYKLEPGVCSNSYGFNVAKLAGLPDKIVDNARNIAKKMEEANNNRQHFVDVFTAEPSSLKEVITAIDNLNI